MDQAQAQLMDQSRGPVMKPNLSPIGASTSVPADVTGPNPTDLKNFMETYFTV